MEAHFLAAIPLEVLNVGDFMDHEEVWHAANAKTLTSLVDT